MGHGPWPLIGYGACLIKEFLYNVSMGLVLRPWYDTLEAKGVVSYDNNARCWNTIRVRKNFIKQFPQLKQRRTQFSYKMIFYASYEELKKAVERMEKSRKALPILLYLVQEQRSE